MGSINRQHPRVAADVGIKFYVGTQQVTEGRTRNVSRGGLCADLTSSLPNGKDVEIEMRLVFDDNSQSEPLRLPARIVWCTTLEGAYQVGIAFRPLDKRRAEYLTMFLKYLGEHDKPSRSNKATNIDDRFR
ncbi:MAG TPA: PilZ domain-containing protein [Kofleriaceae bacterium]